MTALGWFAIAMGYIVLLIVLIGGLSGVRRQLWVLADALDQLRGTVSTLSKRVDDAAHQVQVMPQTFLTAYDRSRKVDA